MYEPAVPLVAPNPWLSIWTQPRATIRFLAETDPRRGVVLLAALGGVSQSLSQAMDRSLGEVYSLPMILVLSAGIGSIAGIITLYIAGFLLHWTGQWIGGKAERGAIRLALGWANLPLVAFLFLTLTLITALGPVLFLSEESIAAAPLGTGGALLLMVYGLVTIALGIWSLVLLLQGLGEVQGFSAWKALGNVVLSAVPLMIIVIVAVVIAVIT